LRGRAGARLGACYLNGTDVLLSFTLHGSAFGVVSRSVLRRWLLLSLALVPWGCAASSSAPVTPGSSAAPPTTSGTITWDDKISWIIRLEDQRLVREPNPPAPAIIRPATRREPAIVAPLPPTDLIRLLGDSEARVRRRAALALGRVGLPIAIEPLSRLLDDEEIEVRQMAAFALGLIANGEARPVLLRAIDDPDPIMQGRAAEALGAIGDRADAAVIGAMVQRHVAAGALLALQPDDLTYPMAPPVEAIRLGVYALARLKSYDAIAGAVLDGQGQPLSRWWPIAYALQRTGDVRAVPALLTLLDTPGRYTAAFAERGLASMKAVEASEPLRRIVSERKRDPAVVVQAVRALQQLGDTASTAVFTSLVSDRSISASLRAEVMTSLAAVAGPADLDFFFDQISDASPRIRAATLTGLARIDPDAFLSVLASLDADRDWTVRVALATALGGLPDARGVARLRIMLQDRDMRVIPSVLKALAAAKAPGIEDVLIARLKSDDFVIRATAAGTLADLKVARAVAPLVEAYRAARDGDVTYVARAAVLGAIAMLDPAAARPLLEESLRDRDWAVRVRARALLKEQGVADVEETMRPATVGEPVDSPEWQAIALPSFSPHAFIETERGTIELELAVLDAPLTVHNFITLARKGFFNNVAFHRVVPDFVVQDGDPRGDGEGGPGYTIRDEINERPYLRGTVGMALDWQDTGGSQFFITHSPQPHLDGRYTVFGTVVNGMDVVDQLVPGDVVRSVRVRDGINPE